MFVAVDDTDSVKGNCTTFLATEIVRELKGDYDLIGNPRLVRLNPAVPWKTRGNGALCMRFGRGVGEGAFIGMIGGERLLCYRECEEPDVDIHEILERLEPLVDEFHSEDSDPGLVVTLERPDPLFYFKGVRTIVDCREIDAELERIGAAIYTIGCGRGLVGSVCGLAWTPADSTYELLAYRHRERWGTPREYDPLSIRDMEHSFPTTFNSWEDRAQKVAMVPATPCPVLYGLRGDVLEDVIAAADTLVTEERERWAVFLTNQGTDDHIIRGAEELVPNQSYLISGTVASYARHIRGGHTFIDVSTRCGTVTCGAYEPSKEFRMAFDHLAPGDEVEVMGEYRDSPRTLNAEKLHVVSVRPAAMKTSNPVCPVCGKNMKSAGSGQGFRCRRCHTRSSEPESAERTRWIVPGWYEPPTAARRHLSKPLKRMGLEQPVEFVNRRTP